jgi:hypothetical protein
MKGERQPRLKPFQSIQVHFTEMPAVGWQKYLRVIIDHFTSCVEAFPLSTAMAGSIIKVV